MGVCPAPGLCPLDAQCVRWPLRKSGAVSFWPQCYWMRALAPHSLVFPGGRSPALFLGTCSGRPVSPKSISFSLEGPLRLRGLWGLLEPLGPGQKGPPRTSCHSQTICCASQSCGLNGKRRDSARRLTSASPGYVCGGWGPSACACPRVWSVCQMTAWEPQLFRGRPSQRRQSG